MSPAIAAATTIVALGAIYAAVCVVNPFPSCGKCAGAGTRKTLLAGVRTCRRCRGHGRQIRLGRRIYNCFAWLRARAVTSEKR